MTRQQLETEGYSEFFYFGRLYLGLWLVSLLFLLIVAFLIYGPLLDPAFKPSWSLDFHCNTKGCFLVRLGAWALAFFLTLPVWMKLSTALLFGSGSMAGSIQRIARALDAKPDIALGPGGLYFPGRTSYHRLDWRDVSRIVIVRYRHKKTLHPTPTIRIFGQKPIDNPQNPIWPIVEPLVCAISPSYGFNQADVINSIRRHAPAISMSEVEESIG